MTKWILIQTKLKVLESIFNDKLCYNEVDGINSILKRPEKFLPILWDMIL